MRIEDLIKAGIIGDLETIINDLTAMKTDLEIMSTLDNKK